jgi:hypothetical protein
MCNKRNCRQMHDVCGLHCEYHSAQSFQIKQVGGMKSIAGDLA